MLGLTDTRSATWGAFGTWEVTWRVVVAQGVTGSFRQECSGRRLCPLDLPAHPCSPSEGVKLGPLRLGQTQGIDSGAVLGGLGRAPPALGFGGLHQQIATTGVPVPGVHRPYSSPLNSARALRPS